MAELTFDELMERQRVVKAAMFGEVKVEILATPNRWYKMRFYDGVGAFIVELESVKIESISRAAYERIGGIVPYEAGEDKWRGIEQKSFIDVIQGLYKEVERLRGEGPGA